MNEIRITSPVGRMVMGSLYVPKTTNAAGELLVFKKGPNKGQPRVNYFFALAIPKGGERHWAETSWGQQIWNAGHQAFPNAAGSDDFSWKITDGDSTKPGKLYKGKPGRAPAENEGWPGNWVVKFSGGYAPKIVQFDTKLNKFVEIIQTDFIKPGYFMEVLFDVAKNDGESPGMYIKHKAVCFRAYGTELSFSSVNVEEAGFGASALPAGASMTPPAGAIPMPATPTPSAPPPVPAPVPSVPAIPVIPNVGFVQVPPPAVPAVPVAPPPVPAAPVHQMTALAQGASYEACIAAGWTDATLVANGLMVA